MDETEFIIVNVARMTIEAIADRLNRTPETIRRYIDENGLDGLLTPEQQGKVEKMDIRTELRTSRKWDRLRRELTKDEIEFFEEEYVKLMQQFRDDVLASEVTQIFDCIKFEILKSRNMAERKRAREEIERLDETVEDLGPPRDLKGAKKDLYDSLQNQLRAARKSEESATGEYVKLQERHDSLIKSLRSSRDQRVLEAESGKDTILGLLKMLQKDEVRKAEDRQMELMRLAANREYKRLGSHHTFQDGEVDRPILSADTVSSPDEEAVMVNGEAKLPEESELA